MYPVLVFPHIIKKQLNYSMVYIDRENTRYYLPVNRTGEFVLSLCNGENTITEISELVCEKYKVDYSCAYKLVNEFIEESLRVGTIYMSNEKNKINIKQIGDGSYWIPSVVVLELTKKCNLKCIHCYIGYNTNASLNREWLLKVCSEIIEIGVDTVQLTGGEPLLHEYIHETIEILCKSGIRVIVTTNGTVESEKIYKSLNFLKEVNGYVQVSLDGLEATHNKIRGDTNSYQKAVKFIRTLISMGINVDVATSIINQSKEELELLCKYLKNLGVKNHRMSFISYQGRAYLNNLKNNIEEIKNFQDFKKYLKQKYDNLYFKVVDFESEITYQNCINCGAGYNIIKITSEGYYSPCPMMDIPIDHIKNMAIKEFTKKYASYFMQIKSPTTEDCSNCDKYIICKNCILQGLIHSRENLCKWYENNKDSLKLLNRDSM